MTENTYHQLDAAKYDAGLETGQIGVWYEASEEGQEEGGPHEVGEGGGWFGQAKVHVTVKVRHQAHRDWYEGHVLQSFSSCTKYTHTYTLRLRELEIFR